MKKELRFGFALMAIILIVVAVFMPWSNLTNGHLGLLIDAVVIQPREDHAHAHQRESSGETEHDRHHHEPQHQKTQVPIGQIAPRHEYGNGD